MYTAPDPLNRPRFSGKVAIVFFLALSIAHPAHADTDRHCNAEYRIKVTHADGRPVSRPEVSFGFFKSQGRCKNALWRNKCRSEARDLARECMISHWNNRWERTRGWPCHYNSRGRKGPKNYTIEDLKAELEWYTCFQAAPGFGRDAIVQFRGVIWGKKKCDSKFTLENTYRVTPEMCAQVDSKAHMPPSRR